VRKSRKDSARPFAFLRLATPGQAKEAMSKGVIVDGRSCRLELRVGQAEDGVAAKVKAASTKGGGAKGGGAKGTSKQKSIKDATTTIFISKFEHDNAICRDDDQGGGGIDNCYSSEDGDHEDGDLGGDAGRKWDQFGANHMQSTEASFCEEMYTTRLGDALTDEQKMAAELLASEIVKDRGRKRKRRLAAKFGKERVEEGGGVDEVEERVEKGVGAGGGSDEGIMFRPLLPERHTLRPPNVFKDTMQEESDMPGVGDGAIGAEEQQRRLLVLLKRRQRRHERWRRRRWNQFAANQSMFNTGTDFESTHELFDAELYTTKLGDPEPTEEQRREAEKLAAEIEAENARY
jgi:hypothetical protein